MGKQKDMYSKIKNLSDEDFKNVIKKALLHIKRIEHSPELGLRDAGVFDEWVALNDSIDINIREVDLGFKRTANTPFDWHCKISDGTDSKEIFKYKKGRIKLFGEKKKGGLLNFFNKIIKK